MGRVILAFESSCDETAVAVMCGGRVLSSRIASQVEIHERFGGVVPEVASRNHLRAVGPLLKATLEEARIGLAEVDAVAATIGPGLATSLMVGVCLAKGVAVGLGKPFLGINHMEGHALSPFYGTAQGVVPAVGLIVSGGHTLLVHIRGVGEYGLLGQTRDDAAGEAFDKVGKLLGLPYPGGPVVNRLAGEGKRDAFDFPRSMLGSGDLEFSFSGLKTAVRYLLPEIDVSRVADVCASFQEAVVDVLVKKTRAAVRQTGCQRIAVSGGVSRNTRLRERLRQVMEPMGCEVLFAPDELTTDNAAMIGYVAALRVERGESDPITTEIRPSFPLAH
jgi:N6-L-threonylcarbamoyladenine synthase